MALFPLIGKNWAMHFPIALRNLALPIAALMVLTGCASGSTAGWTYAPLGPSANPSAAVSQAPGSGGPTTSIETTQDQPLAFNPADITVAAGSTVSVTYTNNSSMAHNIDFFNGPDNSEPSLGATTIATGPNNTQTVTFTAPTTPGDYMFWCDVHTTTMKGVWHVK